MYLEVKDRKNDKPKTIQEGFGSSKRDLQSHTIIARAAKEQRTLTYYIYILYLYLLTYLLTCKLSFLSYLKVVVS